MFPSRHKPCVCIINSSLYIDRLYAHLCVNSSLVPSSSSPRWLSSVWYVYRHWLRESEHYIYSCLIREGRGEGAGRHGIQRHRRDCFSHRESGNDRWLNPIALFLLPIRHSTRAPWDLLSASPLAAGVLCFSGLKSSQRWTFDKVADLWRCNDFSYRLHVINDIIIHFAGEHVCLWSL